MADEMRPYEASAGSTPFEEGYTSLGGHPDRAYMVAGRMHHDACPYHVGGSEYTDWWRGYNQAVADWVTDIS